jgi:hypothetical protein
MDELLSAMRSGQQLDHKNYIDKPVLGYGTVVEWSERLAKIKFESVAGFRNVECWVYPAPDTPRSPASKAGGNQGTKLHSKDGRPGQNAVFRGAVMRLDQARGVIYVVGSAEAGLIGG